MSDATQAIVSLEVDGVYLDAWDEYVITLDLLAPGSPWTFSIWHADTPRSTWSAARGAAKIGARATVAIDGVVVLDGFVQSVATRHSSAGASLIISGMDLVGSLTKAHADPTISLRNVSLQTAVERLLQLSSVAAEFGEAVSAQQTTRGLRPPRRPNPIRSHRRGQVDAFRPRIGETVWQCIEAVCRRAGFLVWAQPSASADRVTLRVDKPRESGEPSFGFLWAWDDDQQTRAALGSNVLEAEDSLDASDVPTSVTVFADAPRGDAVSARLARQVDNDAFSGPRFSFVIPQSPRFELSARARTIAAAQREATRKIGDANASLEAYACTVQGHTQERRGVRYLYAINEIAHVRDEFAGRDEDMLITRVEFRGNAREGQRTMLRFAPLGAIKCDPQEA